MARIVVIPEHLRQVSSNLRINSENIYSLATQLRGAANCLDWEVHATTNIDSRVNAACKQARDVAAQLMELSHFLSRKAQAFEDTDRQSAEGLRALDGSIMRFVGWPRSLWPILGWGRKLWPFLPVLPWRPGGFIDRNRRPSPIVERPELPGGGQKIVGAIDDLKVKGGGKRNFIKGHDPNNPDATYCNIFAMEFAKKMGVPLPESLDLNGDGKIDDYLSANESLRWLRGTYNNPIGSTKTGAELGWKSIDANEAATLASRGYVVLAGWENPVSNQSGHMAVVRPESTIGNIRIAQAGSTNFSEGSLADGFGNLAVEFFVYLPK